MLSVYDLASVAIVESTGGSGIGAMEQPQASSEVAQLYRSCIALEQKLKEEMKHKNFYEASVRAIRAELRSTYERLLLVDYAGAQVTIWRLIVMAAAYGSRA